MEFKFIEKYYFQNKGGINEFQGCYIFWLITKPFQFRWFTDCGDWFIYIHLGKYYWRLGRAGIMRGSVDRDSRLKQYFKNLNIKKLESLKLQYEFNSDMERVYGGKNGSREDYIAKMIGEEIKLRGE
jgi:hypothetical protein